MTDDIRRDELAGPGPEGQPERQGNREQSELASRRDFNASDAARANEPRTTSEPATSPPREPQEPRSAHLGGRGEQATEARADRGVLGRVRDAWHRIRNRA